MRIQVKRTPVALHAKNYISIILKFVWNGTLFYLFHKFLWGIRFAGTFKESRVVRKFKLRGNYIFSRAKSLIGRSATTRFRHTSRFSIFIWFVIGARHESGRTMRLSDMLIGSDAFQKWRRIGFTAVTSVTRVWTAKKTWRSTWKNMLDTRRESCVLINAIFVRELSW